MRKLTVCISAALASLAMAGSASAQSYDVGGVAVDPSAVTAFDLFNMSQTHFNFGTARSAAMAGAFTSLGADQSSMSINPAGLGMYRHNEVTITPMMTFNNTNTSLVGYNGGRTPADRFEGTRRNRFSLGNTGIILNVRESAKGVTSISLGFGYNRLADYNFRYSFASGGNSSSIADLYARQLNGSALSSSYLNGDTFDWGYIDPSMWGAALGYFTGLVGDPDRSWRRDMIGDRAFVGQFTTVSSRGSLGEYVLAMGMNINNKFYVGASLGIHSLTLRRDIYYGEDYRYDSDPRLNYRMDFFNYDQSTRISGAGINLKVGLIYRPIQNLRLGFAFHTPTYYSLTYRYQAGMTSDVFATDNVDGYQTDRDGYLNPPLSDLTATLVDDGQYGWDYTSPSRMMFGVSYTLGKLAVVSVDYERDWYNGIRVKNSPYGKRLYDDFARENFKGSNTLRIGVEVRLIPQIAVRAGYGMWAGALRDRKAVYSSPVIYRTDYAGAGLGFALSKVFTLDLAYQYTHNRTTDYMTFYYYNDYDDGSSPLYSTAINRHAAILTFGFKF